MPTFVRSGRFTVKVFGPPREHPPPHVHVYCGQSGLIVIRLGIAGDPPKVWRVYDTHYDDVLAAYRLVNRHNLALREYWRAVHGDETPDR